MMTNDLFDQIVKLEETSEDITKKSLHEASEIKKKSKKELEIISTRLKEERTDLYTKLEKERDDEESTLKNKYNIELSIFSTQLTDKYNTNLEKIISKFKEINNL